MAAITPDQGRPTDVSAVLKSQYRAALSMMQQAIERCPDALWLSKEGHDCPYWQIAFHALFFTHFYLQKNESSMTRWAKHRGENDEMGAPTGEPYTKAEMIEYLEFCRGMLDGALAAMDLASPDCGFPWYTQGKLEHQINNIRHLQHHAAQLGDRLRGATGKGLDWTLQPV
jgi:hypothetical protein